VCVCVCVCVLDGEEWRKVSMKCMSSEFNLKTSVKANITILDGRLVGEKV
jgi:hypothetical protein